MADITQQEWEVAQKVIDHLVEHNEEHYPDATNLNYALRIVQQEVMIATVEEAFSTE